MGTSTTAEIQALADKAPNIPLLYAVDSYRITYRTTDKDGASIVASGLVAIPHKAAGKSSPVLSYQHATIKLNSQSPSDHPGADAAATMFASLGYIVQAADYVGYGASKGAAHPYLLAAPSAAATLDFIEAAKRWRAMQGALDNGQLFMAGYSEGAYSTMAALRAMSANPALGSTLYAVMGAGPYDVSLTLADMVQKMAKASPILGAIVNPDLLSLLGATDRAHVRHFILTTLIGSESDIVFAPEFLDRFFEGNAQAVAAQSDVQDFAPTSPMLLFHGRDDATVPYANTAAAMAALGARGAASRAEQVDCHASPSDHIACVPEFLTLAIARLAKLARDL